MKKFCQKDNKVLTTLAITLIGTSVTFPAFALPITLDGEVYEVEIIEGTFEELSDRLDDQPWWENDELAFTAAYLVGDAFGFPNSLGEDAGPFFAIEYIESSGGFTLDALQASFIKPEDVLSDEQLSDFLEGRQGVSFRQLGWAPDEPATFVVVVDEPDP
jgi:hypothetical protein